MALAGDVEKIQNTLEDLAKLEQVLMDTKETSAVMELKASRTKLLTHPDLLDSLKRLEVEGEPTWGLSTSEREMILTLREKMNES